MAKADVWFVNNDMLVRLDTLKSSTMGSTEYVNSSTGVSCHIWKALTTASTANRLTASAVNLPYVAASNGRYQVVAESTAYATITSTVRGMAVISASHAGLNGEWRVQFRGEARSET